MWTAPLYAIFSGLGVYETRFTMTLALGALLVILAAFGCLDGFMLTSLQSVRAELADADSVRFAGKRLERLSRAVLLSGLALGAVGVAVVVVMALP